MPTAGTNEHHESVWARGFRDLDRRDAMILAVLGVTFLIVQIGWLLRAVPITGGDQLDYFSVAGNLQETRVTHRHLRIGLTLPVRLLIQVVGYAEAAYYAVPIMAGLLFLAATYLLGALLHSRSAGTAGAVAATFNPYVLWESSHLLPDLLGAGLFTLGLVVVGASGRTDRGAWDPSLVVAGLLLAWSYLTREFIVIFFPLALLVAWSAGRARWRDIGQIASGALAGLSIELLHGTLVFGNPLARIGSVVGRATPTLGTPAPGAGSQPEAEHSLAETALLLPRDILRRDGGWLLLLLAAGLVVGLVAAAILRRQHRVRQLLVPLLWVLMIYVVMTFFGWTATSDGRSVIRVSKIRYWFPILPAVATGGVIGLLTLLPRNRLPPAAHVVAGVILTSAAVVGAYSGLTSIAHSGSFVGNGGDDEFREFRTWLSEDGSDIEVLYVDGNHGRGLDRILPIFTRTTFGQPVWSGELESISVRDETPASLDGPFVAHLHATERLATRDRLPSYLQNLPVDWSPLMISDNGKLAVFDPRPVAWQQPTEVTIDAEPDGDGGPVVAMGDSAWDLDLDVGDRGRIAYRASGVGTGVSVFAVTLRDDVLGEGRFSVYCVFADEERERAFSVNPDPDDPAAARHYCQGPQLTGIELEFEGPLRGAIESVTASTFAPMD